MLVVLDDDETLDLFINASHKRLEQEGTKHGQARVANRECSLRRGKPRQLRAVQIPRDSSSAHTMQSTRKMILLLAITSKVEYLIAIAV